jgi:hypothetical protein
MPLAYSRQQLSVPERHAARLCALNPSVTEQRVSGRSTAALPILQPFYLPDGMMMVVVMMMAGSFRRHYRTSQDYQRNYGK